jgi:hypothetical protein
MQQRIKHSEEMRDRIETMDEGIRGPACGESDEREKKSTSTISKGEYISRVRRKLHAWISEFEKLQTRAHEIRLDEDWSREVEILDRSLSEGCEKLRDLMERTDDGWESVRKEADVLWDDILSMFDRVRERLRSEFVNM